MDLTAFYSITAGLSFTLLGLWWVACQSRSTWLEHPESRRMAYVVSLHFMLPGAMSLLAIVAPDVSLMWRITFFTAGAIGLIGTFLQAAAIQQHTGDARRVALIQWVGVPLYALVCAVALLPDVVRDLQLGLAPIQLEAIAVVLLVLLGAQSAWILTFMPENSAR